MFSRRFPLVLTVLDGWGIGPKDKSVNAIEAAKTPFFDYLSKTCPFARLEASGRDVGLERGQVSGSETGHMNIGAGRIVKQDVRMILESIDNGSFFYNPTFLSLLNHIKQQESNIHLVGLMSGENSPHSHPDIFLALLIFLKKMGVDSSRVFFHFFTDGRDSYPKSAMEHWAKWKGLIERVGIGRLLTVSGRFYGMDRAKNWERLMQSYDAMVSGKGERAFSFEEVIERNYKKGISDEYIEPTIIVEEGNRRAVKIEDGDGIILFNFRSDRARQFAKLFAGTNTKREVNFPRRRNQRRDLKVVAMTDFGPDLNLNTAFPANLLLGTLPAVISSKKQLYIAEMEKFAHVTYFFNGGYADSISGEVRIMIESEKVRSYADNPKMSAEEITQVIEQSLYHNVYDVIVLNFANADMVGHTGDFRATVRAVNFLDDCLERIYKKVLRREGVMLITADHGNADIMIDKKSKRPFSFHTKNPVPFILASGEKRFRNLKLKKEGVLGDIAPTMLEIMKINQPDEMTGESLIK